MSQTLTLHNNFLKQVFRDVLQNQVRMGSRFSAKVDSVGKKLTLAGQSLTVKWSNMTALAWRGQALTEGGDFAPSGYISAATNTLGPAHRSFTYAYTGHLGVSGTKKEAAYKAKAAGKRLAEAIRKEATLTRQIFDTNDGTANLATINGTPSANVITLDSGTQMNRFFRGMHVDVRSAATSGTERITTVGNGRIVEVDHLNLTITVVDDENAADNDYVALRGYYDQTVPQGIQSLVSTAPTSGTVQGVNRATAGNDWMRNLTVSGGGAALTNDMIQSAIDHVAQRGANHERIDTLCATHKVVRWFNLVQEGDRRYSNVHRPTAGIEKATFHNGEREIEIMPDRFMPEGNLYLLNLSEWGRAAPEGARGGDWATENGNVLRRSTASSGSGYADELQATWVERDNTFIDDFTSQCVLHSFIAPA